MPACFWTLEINKGAVIAPLFISFGKPSLLLRVYCFKQVKSPDVSGLVLYINLIWAFPKSHILVTFLKAAVQGANILLMFLFNI